MKNLRSLAVYNKLRHLENRAQRILSEASVEVEKTPSDVKKMEPRKEQYGDKKAAVLNLAKVTKATNRENKYILEGALKISKKATESFKDMEVSVKELVVNLTELKNEIKEYNDDKSKDIEKLMKVMRYFVTYKKQTERAINEAEEKRRKYEQELEEEGYFSELDKLESEFEAKKAEIEKKYGADELYDIDEEVEEAAEKQRQGMKKIQEEHLSEIRQIRQIVRETVDLPTEILDNVKIYAMALGAVTQLSKNPDRIQLNKEGIDKILSTPALQKELGEFIETIEYEDSVNIVSARLPKIGTYYSELKTKYNSKMDSFEDAKDQIDEGVFSDLIEKTMDQIIKRGKQFYQKAKDILSQYKGKISTDVGTILGEVEKMKKENAEYKSRFSKLAIELNSEIKKVQYEVSKQTSDEVK